MSSCPFFSRGMRKAWRSWIVQAYVEVGTSKIHGDIHKFKVKPNLK